MFPIPLEEYVGMDLQLLVEKRFAACGNYFGRIKCAYLSYILAANKLY